MISTHDHGNCELCDQIERDLAAAQERIAQLEQWVHDLQSGMYINCVYCGHRYGPQDKVPATMADALKEHIEQCPKHPMSALKERIAQLTAPGEYEALGGRLGKWISDVPAVQDVGIPLNGDSLLALLKDCAAAIEQLQARMQSQWSDLLWLYSHCHAIGMRNTADKSPDPPCAEVRDIALFTIDQKERGDKAEAKVRELGADAERLKKELEECRRNR